MSLQTHGNRVEVIRTQPGQPVGGAILDENGQETPITEAMVQQACQECDQHWVTPEHAAEHTD
ncbi:hypothetical protein RRX38_07175 [Pseudomonas sp. DTU_2021_1001937_2_SI_NGA_ILE_001]|uniref:PA1571 family protein n=1 Tax=Pseudomonas sp. DTU_2021_1001937_2_SI_NGA_ILE_001 TaxID=3077589 RepID=UPI0025D2C3E8|nr:PA1571 family protein [Pseudomonas sp. DTU_2021_1001937_2_SI_NGA_ILE_001]WNW10946.1 hypothetical protein RRX38_07175 [Pseudomonas sp. DTU_2021_1001937_2_SI_NGA_ILE_001]